ncbi:L-alanine exporter AlaE [Rhodobacteraceae bacterium RKSG542]|uniref:L-alanine exporter AlaE n=1 Tax=Pseudovibrio flavus TaxID=2529854 RepID=UPI0012BC32E2|nr:L-alanine exporter AlaE [Pseudovibrio flavus]MTI18694.1 L-alanine exporter AlaE [Pseudovibrio flavus]
MYAFLVDTIATIVFFTIAAATTELFIAGMEPMQVVMTRAIMIPMMIATGRPYGLWRDWVFAKLAPNRTLSRTLVDVAAFISFQVPVYVGALVISGTGVKEIALAVSSGIFFMVLGSRPFGLFLELVRKLAKVQAAPSS